MALDKTIRFSRRGSRQDVRKEWAPKLLASFATTIYDRTVIRLFIAFVFVLTLNTTFAFAGFVTLGNGWGSKWGDPVHGTPSDTITWSFMSQGTTLAAGHPLLAGGATGSSNISSLESMFDANANSPGSFQQAVHNAFNTWSAASNGRVTFQEVSDNGAPSGGSNPNSYAVDIRIGAFHSMNASSFSFAGAVGYGPPGNDLNFPDALAGDIIFNLDSLFFVAPGIEGDPFPTGGPYKNDLEGLILHELGHAAIGLGHPTSGIGDVMYVGPNAATFINRHLSPDDILGLQSVYGVTAVPEPNALLLISIAMLSMVRLRRVTLHPIPNNDSRHL